MFVFASKDQFSTNLCQPHNNVQWCYLLLLSAFHQFQIFFLRLDRHYWNERVGHSTEVTRHKILFILPFTFQTHCQVRLWWKSLQVGKMRFSLFCVNQMSSWVEARPFFSLLYFEYELCPLRQFAGIFISSVCNSYMLRVCPGHKTSGY